MMFTMKGFQFSPLSTRQRDFLICILLSMAVIVVFWQVQDFKFIYYDDGEYVTDKLYFHSASINKETIVWAFTNIEAGFWHPLTWLSLILDYRLFGNNTGGYHWTNVIFHLLNTLLLYLLLRHMTGAYWKSAFVAALFALHPLHVESVAWVSQRKDVLSTFLGLLSLVAYLFYVKNPHIWRYLMVVCSLLLALMAKPMVVTLPFLMLLLDYWPLGRMQLSPANEIESSLHQTNRPSIIRKHTILWLIVEKIPLIALSILASILVIFTERHVGALSTLADIPVISRIANAIISYGKYIEMMFWPEHLAILYPHPVSIGWQQAGLSLLLIILTSFLALRGIRRCPYFIVGWLWYLGTLIPVIGIIQVGPHAMADRYTYIPLIGLFIIIVWGVTELAIKCRYGRVFLSVLSLAILVALAGATFFQLQYWRNSILLFEHAIRVTERNYIAHGNLGAALTVQGQYDRAISNFRKAIEINPGISDFHNNLGAALTYKGKYVEAIPYYLQAIKLSPGKCKYYNNLGNAFLEIGESTRAVENYRMAIKLSPGNADFHDSLGLAYINQNKMTEAITEFQKALAIQPRHVKALKHLAVVMLVQDRNDEAIVHLTKALAVDQTDPEIYNNIGIALVKKNLLREALVNFQNAIALKPEYIEAINNKNKVVKMIQKK